MTDEALRQLRHDLRSPLVVIAGFAQLLEGDRAISDDDRREFARRIRAAAQDLEGLLSERM